MGLAGDEVADTDLAFLVGNGQEAREHPNTIYPRDMFCDLVWIVVDVNIPFSNQPHKK